jgi:hypothetical protein
VNFVVVFVVALMTVGARGGIVDFKAFNVVKVDFIVCEIELEVVLAEVDVVVCVIFSVFVVNVVVAWGKEVVDDLGVINFCVVLIVVVSGIWRIVVVLINGRIVVEFIIFVEVVVVDKVVDVKEIVVFTTEGADVDVVIEVTLWTHKPVIFVI